MKPITGKDVLTYTIPLVPVTKKNSQQIRKNARTGKRFISPSEQYRRYEKEALWYLKPAPCKPIDCPVNIKLTFFMPTRRRVDLVNLEEAALDVLVKANILADDNVLIVASMDGSSVLYDRDSPRTEIEITKKADF